ncbi:MAG: tail fiber domain-containing protein, partial [Proteobacteria bacterium]
VDYTGAGLNNFSLFDNAAGAMRMFITPTGNVGFGTLTPEAPLEVAGVGALLRVRDTSSTGLVGGQLALTQARGSVTNDNDPLGAILFQGSSTGTDAYTGSAIKSSAGCGWGGSYSCSNMVFMTSVSGGFAERMRIDKTGNVGIGTTTPGTKFHVEAGDIYVNGGAYTSNNFNNTAYTSSGTRAGVIGVSAANSAGTDGRATFLAAGARNTANTTQTSYFGSVSTASGFSPDTVIGQATTSATGYVERMRIASNGNIGIGTAAPSTAFHIQKQETAATTLLVENTETTNPARAIVQAKNSQGENVSMQITGIGYAASGMYADRMSLLSATTQNGLTIAASDANGPVRFYAGGSATANQRMIITNGGNVGIGTAAPDALLHVKTPTAAGSKAVALALQNAGNASGSEVTIDFNPTNFAFQGRSSQIGATADGANGSSLIFRTNSPGASAADRMRIDQYGNVGIGTTAPAYKLQVAGIIAPTADGTYDLGATGFRFNTLYAVNGTVNTSDVRQKRLIENSDLGLDFVNTLRPVSYKWKVGDNEIHYGVIAQETEAALKAAKEKAGKSETTTAIV